MVMGVPQHIINNGVHIELDLAGSKPTQWLTLAPQFYYQSRRNDNLIFHNTFESVVGAGLEIYRRNFLSHKRHGRGAYFSWGGGYRYFDIKTSDYLWKPVQENGLTYYHRKDATYHVGIHSLSARAMTGVQVVLDKHLLLDVFAGFGVRYSSHQQPEGGFARYNHSTSDYGYTGTMFVGGIRLGVGW